jgi:glycosyltransferase involved in cell wall biosynthesis
LELAGPISHSTARPDRETVSRAHPNGSQARPSAIVDLTIIVLTLNEERHIARCLESVRDLAKRVVIVDSGSTDKTRTIAAEMGADVYTNPFINHSAQLNWGLDNAQIQTEWTMRLDADEVVTPQLNQLLRQKLPEIPASAIGLTVNRQIHFMGKWIRHGGIYPIRMLRIWRSGLGRCENRWMDEHVVVEGAVSHLNADIADINLNNISWWIRKHNEYSVREAIELLRTEDHRRGDEAPGTTMSRQARIKRWVKYSLYAHLPLGFRSAAYFFYRYFLSLGFLDGWRGFAFHFLQGFWYRFLVDVKMYELRAMMKERGQTLPEVVKTECGFRI